VIRHVGVLWAGMCGGQPGCRARWNHSPGCGGRAWSARQAAIPGPACHPASYSQAVGRFIIRAG